MKPLLLIFLLTAFRVAAKDPAPAQLPEGTIKVELCLYDYTVDLRQPRIEKNGQMHPGLIADYTKILEKEQIGRLLKAMTQNHDPSDRYICDFAPHHGIVFRGEDDKILGSISICFHCNELHSETFPKIGSPFHSYWDWAGLRALIKDCGLPILASNEAYAALRKPTGEGGAARPAIAPEPKGKGKWDLRKDLVIHEAIVAGTKVKVVVSEQAFDPTKHRLEEGMNIGTKEKPEWVGPTVDYKSVVGNSVASEGGIPPAGCPQLKSIEVYFGDVLVEVPSQLLNNVFFPRLGKPGVFSLDYADSIVSVSSDAQCVQISIGVGEGGGQSTAFFAVSKDGRATEQTPMRDLPGR